MTTITSPLAQMLDPLVDCLTPEVAARILALRADDATQAKIDDFAERHHEGQLTPEELDEYTAMVHAASMISVLQAKARAALARG